MAFLEEYTLLDELGRGGYATVYKVRHNKLGYVRAIRVLNALIAKGEEDETYQKFLDECRLLLRLGNGNHPNIVHIYQPLLRESKVIVEMDYVDGLNLYDYLKKNDFFLPVSDVLALLKDIGSALAYCHEDIYKYCMSKDEDGLEDDPNDGSNVLIDDETRQQLIEKYRVIHNDIHSGNIIRRDNGSYILLDFGLAIEGNEVVRSSRKKNDAPEFKDPEKWDNEGSLTTETDIYSFGVVLYEYLAGREPFVFDKQNSNATEAEYLLNKAHKGQAPEPIFGLRKAAFEKTHPGKTYVQDYPQWLEDMIMKCLAKAPYDRYANGRELFDEVEQHLNSAPVVTKPKPDPKPKKSNTSWIIVSLLLVIGGMLLYFWHQKDYNQENAGGTDSVILINETTFPDPIFRKYVRENFDKNGDGVLSQSEADAVTEIDVNKDYNAYKAPDSEKISSLKGIEYFSELKYLDCRWNQLTRLDLSKNAKLTKLYCNNNQLTTLNVSKNAKLERLECNDNQLTTLDVSKNAKLWSLDCENNQLKRLDVSKNTKLTFLWCSDNQLTTLDVSKNTELRGLACGDNQLTTLDVSNNTELGRLDCDRNRLTSLDVSKNTKLDSLVCGSNQLTRLDVSKNAKLWSLDCENNQLKRLDVSKNTELEYLSCDDDVAVKGFAIAINETRFPDPVFRKYVQENIDTNKDGILSWSEATAVTEIDVNKDYNAPDSEKISSLKGIEYFSKLIKLWCDFNQLTNLDVSKNTKLTNLGCSFNQLTTLDVSKNTELTKLYCNNNQLTTLDVSKNTELTKLYCNNNQLTTLDVSKNTELTELYCYYNQLTTLDVSKNTELEYLSCDKNQLTTLDVSKNTKLERLFCDNNQLTTLDVSKNTKLTGLYCYNNQLTTLDVSKNTKLKSLDCYNNQLTTLDVSKNTELTSLSCYDNQLTTLDVSKNTELTELYCNDDVAVKEFAIAINETSFPDPVFRKYVQEKIDKNGDGVLSKSEADAVTKIEVNKDDDAPDSEKIYSLKGIEYFSELEKLYCSDNQLTILDVSKNTELRYLECDGNRLTRLDVSKNAKLSILSCWGNRLTTLDLSKNTELTFLWCSDNQLTTLDVSKNTELTELYCWYNQLTTLDLSKNTKLTKLYCDKNLEVTGYSGDISRIK